jgi:vacuolar-type H+-ATPase subunit H
MNSEAENIVELERAILIEAREEAEQMQVEAKEKADAIHKRAQEQAESERKAVLDRAREDADRLRSQSTATAQLKARSSQLEHREKVLDNVFTGSEETTGRRQKAPGLRCHRGAVVARGIDPVAREQGGNTSGRIDAEGAEKKRPWTRSQKNSKASLRLAAGWTKAPAWSWTPPAENPLR